MALEFVLGIDKTKKRQEIIRKIDTHLKAHHENNVIYIVPTNVTYETTTMLLNAFKEDEELSASLMRTQVYNFGRLAWFFRQNKLFQNQKELSETGLNMLVAQLIRENEKELTVFRGEVGQAGFIEKMVNLFQDFRLGGITPHDLLKENRLQFKEKSEELFIEDENFEQKMSDISLLYDKFCEKIADKYILREDLYDLLISDIEQADLNQTLIVIDHFESFSAMEIQTIMALVKNSQQVLVNLLLDHSPLQRQADSSEFFYQATHNYFKLYNAAINAGLQTNETFVETDMDEPHDNAVIEIIKRYWRSSAFTVQNPSDYFSEISSTDTVQFWQANSKKSEVFHAGNYIKRLIAENNYRYRDVAIVIRDIDEYRLQLEQVFDEQRIPFFISRPATMADHPLFELLDSVYRMITYNFRHEDVIRFLRTELFIPDLNESAQHLFLKHDLQEGVSSPHSSTEEILDEWGTHVEKWRRSTDILENVALALGYERGDWLNDEEWVYSRYQLDDLTSQDETEEAIQQRANQARSKFQEIIKPFIRQLKEVQTNKEGIILLYQWLEDIGVRDQLLFWRDQLTEMGKLAEAEKHEQAWQQMINIFDEWVELLGEEPWDYSTFHSIIQVGFENAQYSIIPPTIDQVEIISYDFTSFRNYQAVIVLGMNNQTIPQSSGGASLITDEDREVLTAQLSDDKYLPLSTKEKTRDEAAQLYKVMSQSDHRLILSYATAADSEGAQQHAESPYFKQLREALNFELIHLLGFSSLDKTDGFAKQLMYVGTAYEIEKQWLDILRQGRENRKESLFWNKLYKATKGAGHSKVQLLDSLKYSGLPEELTADLAKRLYLPNKDDQIIHDNLYLSVSQLESYYADPFGHFLRYGLKLRERQVQELTPLERGNFYHDALDQALSRLLEKFKNLEQVTDEELKQSLTDTLVDLYQKKSYRLFNSSERMKFTSRVLEDTVFSMLTAIRNQSKKTKLQPFISEVLFGQIGGEKGLPPLTLPLDHGGEIQVRGKIDRVDFYEDTDNQTGYYSVVDYKSSEHEMDFTKIYYGVQLQLLTYLNVVEKNAVTLFNREIPYKKVGMFYSEVQDPLIDFDKTKSFDSERAKSYRQRGLSTTDIETYRELLTNLEDSTELYSFRVVTDGTKIDGRYKKRVLPVTSDVEDQLTFEKLLQYSEHLIRRAGNEILSGNIILQPLKGDKIFTPSTREFQVISQFDESLPENESIDLEFNEIKGKEDLIKKIQAELEK